MSSTRRQFLTFGGAALGAAAVGVTAYGLGRRGADATSAPPTSVAPSIPPSTTVATPSTAPSVTTAAPPVAADGRVLVVVQLGGGNDGLNTLVPLQGGYHDARPTLGLADDGLVPFPGTEAYGLHPALAPLRALLAAGQVAALEAIGYPHPDRSHFAAMDDWWSATPGRSSTTGWLGRWLDATSTGDDDPLRAVALGGGAPALIGDRSRPTVVLSPAAFRLQGPKGLGSSLPDLFGRGGDADVAARYRRSIADAAAAVATFSKLTAPAADGAEAGEGAEGEIARALGTAAQLVTQVPSTRLIQVGVGGFDTHAGQAETQKRLLGDLAGGIASFFALLTAAGVADRVLLVTVSEFGRRVHENGSGGTDHGKAGVSFVAGPAVRGGVYGAADLGRLDDGDLAPQIDVRQLYAAALGWLGGPVDEVLGSPYDALGVVRV